MSPPPVGNYAPQTIPDDHTLSVLVESSPLVVVHFGAEWCAPCKAMNDAMEALAGEVENPNAFAYCDAEVLEESAEKYEVTSVPTFVIVKSGEVVKTIEGADVGQLTRAVKMHCFSNAKSVEDEGKFKATNKTTVMKASKEKETTNGNNNNNNGRKETEEELQKRLVHLTTVQPVVLFMKGNRESPQCGFSRKSSEALTNCGSRTGRSIFCPTRTFGKV